MRAKYIISAAERRGLLLLLILSFIYVLVPYIIALLHPPVKPKATTLQPARWNSSQETEIDTSFVDYTPESRRAARPNRVGEYRNFPESRPDSLFPFDPNQLSATDAKRLGLSNLVYSNLQKYLQAGGKIRSAEQFRSLYGMTETTWSNLAPFIKLPEEHKKVISHPYGRTIPLNVDLQTASPKELMRGLSLDYKIAYRTVNYRERLGGFTHINQLREVSGMTDSTMNELSSRVQLTGAVRRLNPNTASAERLQAHPYIGYKKARCIAEYRLKNGQSLTQDHLKNLYGNDTASFRKVLDYIDFSTTAFIDTAKELHLPGRLNQ